MPLDRRKCEANHKTWMFCETKNVKKFERNRCYIHTPLLYAIITVILSHHSPNSYLSCFMLSIQRGKLNPKFAKEIIVISENNVYPTQAIQ